MTLRPLPWQPNLGEALALATTAHVGQRREADDHIIQYIAHPGSVVAILRSVNMEDPVVLSAAYLHDTIEMASVTFEEIRDRFGPLVAWLVKELTRPKGKPFTRDDFIFLSPEARLIKLADRIDNIRDLRLCPSRPAWARDYLQVTREAFFNVEPFGKYGEAERLLQARLADAVTGTAAFFERLNVPGCPDPHPETQVVNEQPQSRRPGTD
jgi:hypothetical protein